MRKLLSFCLLAAMLLSGCSQVAITPTDDPKPPTTDDALVELYNQFGFNLYHELVSDENRVFSPLSVALALAMAYNGADGSTQEAMAQTLRVQGIDIEAFNQKNQDLLASLAASDVTLDIANSIWLRQGTVLKPDFASSMQDYNALVQDLDFNSPSAVEAINRWVKEKTNNRIEKIIDGPISPDTLLYLINAIYFKGDWSTAFDKGLTSDGEFQLPSGAKVTVPFMQRRAKFDYFQEQDLQAIRLPYGEGRMAMYIFLPQNLAQFHNQLNHQNWQDWMGSFARTEGRIALPKFKLAYEASLNDALGALGMQPAFDEGQADFSRMVDQRVYISEVKHKAFIEVNEEGTEAAAVTGITVEMTSMPLDPFEMVVDRPFFFVIHDRVADAILFMGSVQNPS